MTKRITEKTKVLNYMKSIGGITKVEAATKNISWNLAGRIYDLRNDGHIIKSEIAAGTRNAKRYYLVEEKAER